MPHPGTFYVLLTRLLRALRAPLYPTDRELRDQAVAEGRVHESAPLQLPSVTFSSGRTVTLTHVPQQFLVVRRVALDSDAPDQVRVTRLLVGDKAIYPSTASDAGGVPLRRFLAQDPLGGVPLGYRLVCPGQVLAIALENLDPENAHTVSGYLVADEISSYHLYQTLLRG